MYSAGDATNSSGKASSIILPLTIYAFFIGILFMIVKRGYDFMVSR
jgi:hypothetical protein